MMSYTSGFKPKAKHSATDFQPQFASTYTMDANRKSIANHHPLPKVVNSWLRKIKSIEKSILKTTNANQQTNTLSTVAKDLNLNRREGLRLSKRTCFSKRLVPHINSASAITLEKSRESKRLAISMRKPSQKQVPSSNGHKITNFLKHLNNARNRKCPFPSKKTNPTSKARRKISSLKKILKLISIYIWKLD